MLDGYYFHLISYRGKNDRLKKKSLIVFENPYAQRQ